MTFTDIAILVQNDQTPTIHLYSYCTRKFQEPVQQRFNLKFKIAEDEAPKMTMISTQPLTNRVSYFEILVEQPCVFNTIYIGVTSDENITNGSLLSDSSKQTVAMVSTLSLSECKNAECIEKC